MPVVVVTDYTFPSLEIEQGVLKPAGVQRVSSNRKDVVTLVQLVAEAAITWFVPINAEVIDALR